MTTLTVPTPWIALEPVEAVEAFPDLARHPRLVIGFECSRDRLDRRLVLEPDRTWLRVHHLVLRPEGPLEMVCTELTHPEAVAAGIRALVAAYAGSEIGAEGLTLDELLEYRNRVGEFLHLNVERTFRGLAEGFYPLERDALSSLLGKPFGGVESPFMERGFDLFAKLAVVDATACILGAAPAGGGN